MRKWKVWKCGIEIKLELKWEFELKSKLEFGLGTGIGIVFGIIVFGIVFGIEGGFRTCSSTAQNIITLPRSGFLPQTVTKAEGTI